MDELRCCTKCSNFLHISMFRKDRKYITYTCQPCNLLFLKQHRDKNKDHITIQKNEWYVKNKEYVIDRRKNTLHLKLANALRVRLNRALKNNQKTGSAVVDLGCSIEDLKLHLESKFQQGMNWGNWSKYGWHIDHIRPFDSFDLTDPIQLKQACHYTNLQPMWAKINLSKGAKWEKS